MIHVFLGTKAQLIKMAPVMYELQQRDIDYNFVFSGQHQATVDNIRDEFGIKAPDVVLYTGRDITGIAQMALWATKLLFYSLRNRTKVWRGDKTGIVLVHGDTFSTLIGAILAKASGLKCAHVEAGLRSFDLLNPFPEEITRLATFSLSDVLFAPGEWARNNLQKYKKKETVDTRFNTLRDSLRICEQAINSANVLVPDFPFAIVSCHRFENIFSRPRLQRIVDTLLSLSTEIDLLFILHEPTKKKLIEFGLLAELEAQRSIHLHARYSYFQFIKLVKKSTVVITDGGSNQEECYYLGKPCVLLRSTTERTEGIGENVTVSNYDTEVIRSVIRDPHSYASNVDKLNTSPSRLIVDYLTSSVHL